MQITEKYQKRIDFEILYAFHTNKFLHQMINGLVMLAEDSLLPDERVETRLANMLVQIIKQEREKSCQKKS